MADSRWARRTSAKGGYQAGSQNGGSGKGGWKNWPEHAGGQSSGKERDAENAVVSRLRSAAEALGLDGDIKVFGSHCNGFSTSSSDLDLTYMPPEGKASETPVGVLQQFANELPKHGFTSIVSIFQASVPIVKAVDLTGVEVDLCVGNQLGVQNSKLIAAYCALDPRVSQVGKLVKHWAKAWEIVGSIDGHMNSYAYTLLTLFYLMKVKPPVIPNLQDLAAQGVESVTIRDRRWGREDLWECKFWEDVHLLPRSPNTQSAETLLRGFFKYYTQEFDWANDAVSIRAAALGEHTSKFGLFTAVQKEQWYVEDPFDLRHNLASQCSVEGKARILEKMSEAYAAMAEAPSDDVLCHVFEDFCNRTMNKFLLKCRVNVDKVSATDFTEALQSVRDIRPFEVRFPASKSRILVTDAFAVFQDDADRRKVHRLNETYVGEWQLRLVPCSSWALEDALGSGVNFEELEAVPVQMPQEVFADESADQAAETVRSGLRAAQNQSEVKVLIQRAQAMGLPHEVDLGNLKLRQLTEGIDVPATGPEEPREGVGTDGAEQEGRSHAPSAEIEDPSVYQ